MYGIHSLKVEAEDVQRFENDVKMYGIHSVFNSLAKGRRFENDVNLYGVLSKSKRKPSM